MAILDFQPGSVGQGGVIPTIWYIATDDTLATIMSAGYLNSFAKEVGGLSDTTILLISSKTSPNVAASGVSWLAVQKSGNSYIVVPPAGSSTILSIVGTANQITASTVSGVVTLALASNAILPGTGGVQLPGGTTAQRAGAAGTIRFNSQAGVFEGTVDGSTWAAFESSSTGVISVSGTPSVVVSSPTTGNVVIDISNVYAGQTSITTVGTITTGLWQSTVIFPMYGGTGVNNGVFTITLGGSLVTTGAFSPTLNFQASNTYAFPVASQTLAGLAGFTMAGTINMGSNILTGLPTPINPSDAVPLSYLSSGFVTSVTGTTNIITASPTTGAVVVDISPSYVGQSSITTLGTITTGVWNGSVIPLANGGTNATLTASNGGIVYTNATQMQVLAGNATANKVLLSGSSTTPSWSTATYPVTTTANTLLYSSAANTIATLATANNGVLVTNGTGAPSISSTLPAITMSGTLNMASNILTGLTTPVNPSDAVPLSYLSSSAVTSVSGTANIITVSPTTGAVVVNISPSYVGQSSITTLGTITTGTWHGTLIGPTYGGTGVNNGSNTLTLAGSLTTTGAFTPTLAFQGSNTYTFPVASQTLAGLAGFTMAGAINMGTFGINSMADPVNPQDAVTLNYLNSVLPTYPLPAAEGGTGVNNGVHKLTLAASLTTLGSHNITLDFSAATANTTYAFPSAAQTMAGLAGFTMAGTINMGSNVLTGLTTPVNPSDAVPLSYLSSSSVTSIAGTANQITASASTGAVTLAIASNAVLPGTGGVQLPSGTTAQQAGAAGTIRYNSQTDVLEGTLNGSTWSTFLPSGGGSIPSTSTSNQVLLSVASSSPVWSTATYPGTVATNSLLYANATNSFSALSPTDSAILASASGGTPQWVAPGDTGLVSFYKGSPGTILIPGRNAIINGDFQIWQRGAGGTATFSVPASTTQYTADRWQIKTSANNACTVSQSVTLNYVNSCVIQRNSGQTGTLAIRFATTLTLDMSTPLTSASYMTLSFYAKRGANFSGSGNSLNVTAYFGDGTSNQSGIGGSFSSETSAVTTSIILGTSFAYYSTTIAVPASQTQICIEFNYAPSGTAGAADSFTLQYVQLEASPNPTPFDVRTFTEQLMACQRFYNKTFPYSIAPAQNTSISNNIISAYGYSVTWIECTWFFQTQMLVDYPSYPTVTTYNYAGSDSNWYGTSGGSVPAYTTAGANSVLIYSTTATIGSQYYIHASADCDLT